MIRYEMKLESCEMIGWRSKLFFIYFDFLKANLVIHLLLSLILISTFDLITNACIKVMRHAPSLR